MPNANTGEQKNVLPTIHKNLNGKGHRLVMAAVPIIQTTVQHENQENQDNIDEAPILLPVDEEPPEEKATPRQEKKIELSQDDFLQMIQSIDFSLPLRGKQLQIDFDVRLTIYNPLPSEKGQKITKGGPLYSYKISFGKFFKEKNLDFSKLLVGSGLIHGVNRTLLLFDNDYFNTEETFVLPRRKKGDKSIMNMDIQQVTIGASLAKHANVQVNKKMGSTTEYKWQVVMIAVKDLKQEDCKTMYLVDETRSTFDGKENANDQSSDNNK